MPSTLGDFKMVWIHENKLLLGTFLMVCMLALVAATAAQAQSMSARGIDMSALKNQQANPCKRQSKIYMPIHPYSDSDGCVGVVTKTQSGNDFNIGVSAAFKDETTFEGDSVFEEGVKIGNAGRCTSSADAGALRYNSGTSKIEFCDGSSFRDLDGPKGPRGDPGDRGPGGADGEITTGGSYTVRWSACSESCGGGTQTPRVSCAFDRCAAPAASQMSQGAVTHKLAGLTQQPVHGRPVHGAPALNPAAEARKRAVLAVTMTAATAASRLTSKAVIRRAVVRRMQGDHVHLVNLWKRRETFLRVHH